MKVLVIGIDSLDPVLLSRFGDDLPNFSRLRDSSPMVYLESIFPTDSVPAWATIFTGLNPARHGLIHAFDVFESSWDAILKIDTGIYQGRTFWDRAGEMGKKTCVIFPHGIYPPWPTQGVMVCRSFDGRIAACPQSALEGVDVATLREPSGRNPGPDGMDEYVRKVRQAIAHMGAFGLDVAREQDWDLFFFFVGCLDAVQHIFWRYYDEDDPTHPGPTPFKDTIKEFYVLLDDLVGEFLGAFPDCAVVVLSDHGHGMRPPKTVNVNEVLRQAGLLRSKKGALGPVSYLLETFKRVALDFVHRFELDHLMLRLSKLKGLSSVSKNIYMSKSSIDMERTVACLSSFAGPKSYPYGGIEIREENLARAGMTYEQVRSLVTERLLALEHPETGERLVKWVCNREDLYSGPHIGLYPDVLFELEDGYGVFWGIHTPLIGTAYEHNLASGGHKKGAVFLVSNVNKEPLRKNMALMDVAPSILDVSGIVGDFHFDGSSIFSKCTMVGENYG
jgi:predicted AlkP superfamily phosphohydrolase/phosphomutase